MCIFQISLAYILVGHVSPMSNIETSWNSYLKFEFIYCNENKRGPYSIQIINMTLLYQHMLTHKHMFVKTIYIYIYIYIYI